MNKKRILEQVRDIDAGARRLKRLANAFAKTYQDDLAEELLSIANLVWYAGVVVKAEINSKDKGENDDKETQ